MLAGRTLLVRILRCICEQVQQFKEANPQTSNKTNEISSKSSDEVKDCRLLMKTLVLGLKNIVWGISSCTPPMRHQQVSKDYVTCSLQQKQPGSLPN